MQTLHIPFYIRDWSICRFWYGGRLPGSLQILRDSCTPFLMFSFHLQAMPLMPLLSPMSAIPPTGQQELNLSLTEWVTQSNPRCHTESFLRAIKLCGKDHSAILIPRSRGFLPLVHITWAVKNGKKCELKSQGAQIQFLIPLFLEV